jgi:hypothetical protein
MAADCARSGLRIDPKHIEIKVDDTGLGGGVTDRLKELSYRVAGIDFGGKAVDPEEFFNRGSEMWFTTSYRARDTRLDLSRLPDDVFRRLSAELRARRYKIQSDKTLRAESKDDIKKRIGRSPDDADALVLAFASARITMHHLAWEDDDAMKAQQQKESYRRGLDAGAGHPAASWHRVRQLHLARAGERRQALVRPTALQGEGCHGCL